MTQKEFKKLLKERGYSFTEENGVITINNQGYVYLRSLTTLPEGVQFNNQGDVYLSGLTTLSEGVQFNNQGNVYLNRLTTLPEGVQFNNQGNVYLRSLTTDKIKYKNLELTIKTIDGCTMIIDSEKKKSEFIIYNCRYFGGGDLGKLQKCYIAKRGDFYAHAESIKEAIEDVNFKFLQENADISELVSKIKEKKTMNVVEYRLITGACSFGCTEFLKEKGIEKNELPLNVAIKEIQGYYGSSRINELFN